MTELEGRKDAETAEIGYAGIGSSRHGAGDRGTGYLPVIIVEEDIATRDPREG